jgi:hypothetical protein
METLLNNAIWIIFLITGSIIIYREYKRYLEKNIMTPDDLRRLLRPKISEVLISLANKFIVSVIVATILYTFFHRFLWYTDVLVIVLITNLISIHIYRFIKKYI